VLPAGFPAKLVIPASAPEIDGSKTTNPNASGAYIQAVVTGTFTLQDAITLSGVVGFTAQLGTPSFVRIQGAVSTTIQYLGSLSGSIDLGFYTSFPGDSTNAFDPGIIGRVALANVVRGPWQNATLGYWIDKDSVGQGHASRAVRLAGGTVVRYEGHSASALIDALRDVDVAMVRGHGFDQAAFHALRDEHTTQAWVGFVRGILDGHSGAALFFERERSREAGDSAADDSDAFGHLAIKQV